MISVFCRYGFPRLIISDNGTQFATDLWYSVMKRLNATAVFTTPYHPQSNPTERRNRDVKAFIRKFCEGNHRNWDDRLNECMFVLRTTKLKSTQLTPAKMLLGRELVGPMDIMMGIGADDKTQEVEPQRFVDQIAARIRNAVRFGIENKELAHRIDKIQYDKHRIEYEFQVGDLVMVEAHHLSKKAQGFSAKLANLRDGPYRVETRENRLNYRLVNPKDSKDIVFAHIAQLTRYVSRDGIDPKPELEPVQDSASPFSTRTQVGLGKKRGRKPKDPSIPQTVETPFEKDEPISDELEGQQRITRAKAKELADSLKANKASI
jgi:hypothetical protein